MTILSVASFETALAEDDLRDVRPPSRSVHKSLNAPVGVVWSKVPLRRALTDLGVSQGVAVWLDRRVDPDRRISLVANGLPLKDALAQAAKDQGLDICLFHGVVYLGQPPVAARLKSVGELRRQEVRNRPATVRRFLREEPMTWDDLTAPRELLTHLAEENNLRIDNLDRVVHDLWPAFESPPMTLVDRLTLLLASLDLTFEIDDHGERIRLVPMPRNVAPTPPYTNGIGPEERAIPPKSGQPSARRNARTPGGSSEGPALDRLRVKRVKFKDQPLKAVVRQLAAQLKLRLLFDEDAARRAGIDPNQRISLEREDVSIHELFQAVLEPAGLTFQIRGSMLQIDAARP
ncbi:MAG TPA: hypothetical protein VJL29_00075 [Thermoguttaceae bacterium]|nr:hypothetical protein [Thermoguttaceae bacterium]